MIVGYSLWKIKYKFNNINLLNLASSPIYGHISSTLHGLITIRAFNSQDQFMEQFMIYQDNHTKPAVLVQGTARWCGYHLDILNGVYLTFVAFAGIFSYNGASIIITFINL